MIQVEQHSMKSKKSFYINRIEDELPSSFGMYHKHQFFEIIWITENSEQEFHLIDFKKHELNSNKICILTPNQVHYWTQSSKKGWIIAINSDLFLNFTNTFNNYFFKEIEIVIDKEKEAILKSLMHLIHVAKKDKSKKLIETYIHAVILNLKPEVEQVVSNNYIIDNRIISIFNLIEEFFRTEKETLFYAKKVGLTSKRINEVLKQNTGKTVKQLLSDRIIMEAKRDLSVQSHSIKEIAYQLGFQSAPHFTTFFKKHTNLTPEAYKESLMYHLNK